MKYLILPLIFFSSIYADITITHKHFTEGNSFFEKSMTLKECKLECEIKEKCVAFNYNIHSKKCTLVSSKKNTLQVDFYTTGVKTKHNPIPFIDQRIFEIETNIKKRKLQELKDKIDKLEKEYNQKLLATDKKIKINKELEKKKIQKEKELELELEKKRKIKEKELEEEIKRKKREKELKIEEELKRKKMEKERKLEEELKRKKKAMKIELKNNRVVKNEGRNKENDKIIEIYNNSSLVKYKTLCSLFTGDSKLIISGKCTVKEYPNKYIIRFGINGRPFVFKKTGKIWVFFDEGDMRFKSELIQKNNFNSFVNQRYIIEFAK